MSRTFRNILGGLWLAIMTLHVFTSSGQDLTEGLRNKFKSAVSEVHQEKVYMHTDRDMYVTGETIWLSAYCVDATFHLPSDLSRVLNIELLDNSGHAVKQIRIKMVEGLGNGQLFISPDIRSGHYVLRAYTNWMKNFDTDFVYEKQVSIVNPSLPPLIDEVIAISDSTFIQFFPEGGNLVYGLKSKVAVKVSDEFGKGIPLSGMIFDNENNQVAEFNATNYGFSFFHLLPEKGKTYVARITQDSITRTFELPQVEEFGLVVSVSSNPTGNFNIKVESNSIIQNSYYVIIHTRGKIVHLASIDLEVEQQIELLSKELGSGISHITIMDSDFQPRAERLIFKYPEQQPIIKPYLPKSDYGKREKVRLTLSTNAEEAKEDQTQLSIKVSKSPEYASSNESIITNLLLTSDLKGNVQDASTYFDSNNKYRADQIDLVLLTHGWRRFNWEDVTNEKVVENRYPAELNGPVLSGILSKSDNGDLPRTLLINFIGKASVMNSVDIDPNGLFHFEVPFRVGNDRVNFFTGYDLTANQINIYSPFDLEFNETTRYSITLPPKSKGYFERLNTNIQISQLYEPYSHINGQPIIKDEPKSNFFGKPDYSYTLDDYTRFETVQDLFIEYIRSAIIKNNNKQNGFYVVKDHTMLVVKALTTIDGVPVLDNDYMLNFDPLKIEKIEVISDYYYVGSTRFNGIINFSTYKGDFDEQELPEYLIEKIHHALQNAREYYMPDYNTEASDLKRIPDNRNTLYWNHNISLKNGESMDLEFYTSDDTGTYEIEFNGVSASGRLFYWSDRISVKEKVNR